MLLIQMMVLQSTLCGPPYCNLICSSIGWFNSLDLSPWCNR